MVGRALGRREISIAPLALADFVPTHQPLSPTMWAGGSRLTVEHRRCRSCFLPTAPYQTCCTLGKRDDTSSTMNTAPGTAAASVRWVNRARKGGCARHRGTTGRNLPHLRSPPGVRTYAACVASCRGAYGSGGSSGAQSDGTRRSVAVWLHHDVKFVQQSYAAPLEHHGRAMACVEAHLTGDAIPHLHGKLAQRSDLLCSTWPMWPLFSHHWAGGTVRCCSAMMLTVARVAERLKGACKCWSSVQSPWPRRRLSLPQEARGQPVSVGADARQADALGRELHALGVARQLPP